MHVAVVQLSSQEDVTQNLSRVRELVGDAARSGAALVALPENFAFMGEETTKREIAERTSTDEAGPITRTLVELARKHEIWLVGGGMPEASSDPARPYNTSLLVGPDGTVVARYRKIHMFDVETSDGHRYFESGATSAGTEPVVVDAGDPPVKVGMTVCYDVRFPELYRQIVQRGARIVTVPAAFTLLTGKDHWHVLLRARAIENQVFVLAPAQHGKHPKGRMTYGKSLIVDPWGDVLAQCSEGEGFATARLDFAAQDRVRASLPCLTHRRL
jgi:predicted amidohydrolase